MCRESSRYIFIYPYLVECLLVILFYEKINIKHRLEMEDTAFHTYQSISAETQLCVNCFSMYIGTNWPAFTAHTVLVSKVCMIRSI